MPIFEYLCSRHGRFEVYATSTTPEKFHRCKIGAAEIAAKKTDACERLCPLVPSVPARAQFKGSGFFCNEYPNAKTR